MRRREGWPSPVEGSGLENRQGRKPSGVRISPPPLRLLYVFRPSTKGFTKGCTSEARNGPQLGLVAAGRAGRQDGELSAIVAEPLPVVLIDPLDRRAAVPRDPLAVGPPAERDRDQR